MTDVPKCTEELRSEVADLELQVADLKKEVEELRDFIRGMYMMLSEGEEYEGMPGFLGGAEYGRPNT